jgi:cytochrome c556
MLAAVAPAGRGAAQEAATARAQQKARHDHYHELGKAFKVIHDQARAASPDFAAIKKAAQFVSDASIDQGKWFPQGTGPEAGKTRALPKIWMKPEDFAAAQKLLADGAPALLAAANAGDIEALRSGFATVGKACKNCHDNFRSPEDDD